MQRLCVEYPFGVVAIDVPDSVADDPHLAKDLVTAHFTRCSVALCVMIGVLVGMSLSCLLVWSLTSHTEKIYSQRYLETIGKLERENQERGAKVDELLVAVHGVEGRKALERLKADFEKDLSGYSEVVYQQQLQLLKKKIAVGGISYPKGVQVVRFQSSSDLNEFLSSAAIEQIVNIYYSDYCWGVVYLPKK